MSRWRDQILFLHYFESKGPGTWPSISQVNGITSNTVSWGGQEILWYEDKGLSFNIFSRGNFHCHQCFVMEIRSDNFAVWPEIGILMLKLPCFLFILWAWFFSLPNKSEWQPIYVGFSVTLFCPGLCNLMDLARQVYLSIEFSRQEYWSGLPFPTPGDLPYPRIKPASPTLAGGFFTIDLCGKPDGLIYFQEIPFQICSKYF